MMSRRGFFGLVATVGAAVTCPIDAWPQPAGDLPRIGVLSLSSSAQSALRLAAFRQGLSDLGYAEGRNIAIEPRYADGNSGRLTEFADELARLGVSVFVTEGDASIVAARRASATTPIVAGVTGDLVGPGHAASLSRPGGNVTGLVGMSPDLAGKRLEVLKEVLPSTSRVAVLWNPANPVKVLDFAQTEVAAKGLGIKLHSVQLRRQDELDSAFGVMTRERVDAVVVLPDSLVASLRPQILARANGHLLPTVFGVEDDVVAGGLIAYAPSQSEMFRRAATYVDKILKGEKPADLPVEQPTKFELIVNLKTAKALGIAIPQSILLRADEVIE
jgi:putative ABC transport system substrate-binding protein